MCSQILFKLLKVHAMGRDSGGCSFDDLKGLSPPVTLDGEPHCSRIAFRQTLH